jgi:hypothetical protein
LSFSKRPDQRGSFSEVKSPGREIDHSPSSSVEIKNVWNHTFTPSVCLHSGYRANFTFYSVSGPLSSIIDLKEFVHFTGSLYEAQCKILCRNILPTQCTLCVFRIIVSIAIIKLKEH